jgi:hypothetical protein
MAEMLSDGDFSSDLEAEAIVPALDLQRPSLFAKENYVT